MENTMTKTNNAGLAGSLKALYCKFTGMSNGLQGVAALAARLVMARMFLKSGIIKVQDFGTTIDLFEYEYFEGIPHSLAVVSAALSTFGETVLPLMLIVGFLTRFASAGLLVMTLVIVTLVYPLWTPQGLSLWWNDHVWWAVILLGLLAFGPGNLSLDALLGKK
jgi:putative oxidoreductase